jgi:hypothetical protein
VQLAPVALQSPPAAVLSTQVSVAESDLAPARWDLTRSTKLWPWVFSPLVLCATSVTACGESVTYHASAVMTAVVAAGVVADSMAPSSCATLLTSPSAFAAAASFSVAVVFSTLPVTSSTACIGGSTVSWLGDISQCRV